LDSRSVLPANTILDSSYRIMGVVGSGGFGITYEAEDIKLGTVVAVKEYYPEDFGDRDAASLSVRPKSDRHQKTFEWGLINFSQEARTLARFQHRSIVQVLRVFEANSTAYMVMRFEAGQSLEAWLKGLGRRPTQEELDSITVPLLDALQMMHAANFLHRDIAPDNIIIRSDGTPVLLDFGAARRAFAEKSRSLTGIIKVGYSPHEQYAADARLQGPWTDLYALGATLYRAVTGNAPEEATLRAADDLMLPAASVGGGLYRPEFLKAIDACLEVHHADRPQSVAELRPMLLTKPAREIPLPVRKPAPVISPKPRAVPSIGPLTTRHWLIFASVAALLGVAAGGLQHKRKLDEENRRLEAKRYADAVASQKKAADELARVREQEAARRKAEADAEAKRKAEAEQRRQALFAEARRKAEAERKAREAAQLDPALAVKPGSARSFRDRLASGEVCATCPEMVVVPVGRYSMGSPKAELGRNDTEEDQVEVNMARPLAAGRFPVSRGEFAAFVEATSHKMDGGCRIYIGNRLKLDPDRNWRSPGFAQDDRHPVTCVNWSDAKAYVEWLSARTAKMYRLPTEAEREYVTRAGTATPFWWGSTISPSQANYDGTRAYADGPKGEWRRATVPVDTFAPNAWGLHNVHGNVWEWTEDCWNGSHIGYAGDGTARTDGDCSVRVVRGGSWRSTPAYLRAANRGKLAQDNRSHLQGFRVVRTIAESGSAVPPHLVSVPRVVPKAAPAPTPATTSARDRAHEQSKPEIEQVLAQAMQKIDRGDVIGARQVLVAADDANGPQIAFALAETYDPNMLAAWGARGVAADVAKARALYRKALQGGVARAQARLDALK
jgi:formylglycine-generating enzyme required for sulfatase activity/serine/threonine protein kinase